MKIDRILSNTVPLCSLPNGKLICYQRGNILVLNEGDVESRFSCHTNFTEQLFGWSRLATRLMRFGVRAALALDNEHIILSKGDYLIELNLTNGNYSKGWSCEEGVRPLAFTRCVGLSAIDDGVYFGGYLTNMHKKPVNIYRRTGIDTWEIVYTFPQDTINHIHNIIVDPYRNCLWVFTGDFEQASAIWRVTDNFKRVDCVVNNDQKYRGCIAFVQPEGLLYATDAPFAMNYIYLLNPESLELKKVFPLHGSCIYGCKWKDSYVFSSTVEGDGRDESLFEFCFGRKRGPGIIDENVHLYSGNLTSGFKEIYFDKKDWFPFIFQFGVFRLPCGDIQSEHIYCQPIGTVHDDLCLIELSNIV